MGSIGSSMSRSGRTTAASDTGRRPAIWPFCAKSPSTSWAVTEPPGSACGPVASRPPGMTSTCWLYWPDDFMRRPCQEVELAHCRERRDGRQQQEQPHRPKIGIEWEDCRSVHSGQEMCYDQ